MTFHECVTYYDDVAINGIPIEFLHIYTQNFPHVFTANGVNRVDHVLQLGNNTEMRTCNLRFQYGEYQSSLSIFYDDYSKGALSIPDLKIIHWSNLHDTDIPEEELDTTLLL